MGWRECPLLCHNPEAQEGRSLLTTSFQATLPLPLGGSWASPKIKLILHPFTLTFRVASICRFNCALLGARTSFSPFILRYEAPAHPILHCAMAKVVLQERAGVCKCH